MTKQIFFGFTIIICIHAIPALAAELSIPNQFVSGTPAVADQVNANFNAVKTAVDDNHNRIVPIESALTALQEEETSQAEKITSLEVENEALSSANADLTDRIAALEEMVNRSLDAISGLQLENALILATIDELQQTNKTLLLENTTLTSRTERLEEHTENLQAVMLLENDRQGNPAVFFTGVNVHVRNGSGDTSTVNGLGNLVIGYDEEAIFDTDYMTPNMFRSKL